MHPPDHSGNSRDHSLTRPTRRTLGQRGEQLAAEHLLRLGFRILDRNWRCRRGELDVIAEREDVLLFVEVRSRTNTGSFGTAQEAVDGRKIRRVRELAQHYLYQRGWRDHKTVRFDAICVTFHPDGSLAGFDHIEHAF